MAIERLIMDQILAHPYLIITLTPIFFLLLRTLYRISPFHPLSHIPSSRFYPLTSLVLAYHAYIGDECTAIHQLHQRYGPIVRTGPDSVDIADGDALHPIYVAKGGFLKPAFYGNFDIDGHKSIFSEIVPAQRAPRAKAVVPLFSSSSLRAGKGVIDGCVDAFVARLKREAAGGGRVNILNLTRSLASDVVTAYLFGNSYGGLAEETGLSAAGMVDSFVAVGRFWYLPAWAFERVLFLTERLWPDEHADQSLKRVDAFVRETVDTTVHSNKVDGSYPARLLDAGFSVSETRAQCKDLIFAGTDSTGMNLATIMFFLAKQPETYRKLRAEAQASTPADKSDLQALPYLRSVVKEGLRLSMANPSRLPRVVPGPSGWTFKGTHFPPGTVVSCTPFELHLNEAVFADALAFKPERWLDATDDMSRDSIPFGLGTRQCIARNLAMIELYAAVHKLALEDALKGAKCCVDKIEILEWFNSKVIGENVELVWE